MVQGARARKTLTLFAVGALLLAGSELVVLSTYGADEAPGTTAALVSVGRAAVDRLPSRTVWAEASHSVVMAPAARGRDD